MTTDSTPGSDMPPDPGIPAWLVRATLGITARQLERLAAQGQLPFWVEDMARIYGLDAVRRLARERRALATKDGRVSAPTDGALEVLDGLRLRRHVCDALTRAGTTPEDGFFQFVIAASKTGRPVSPAEWKLIGALADLAIRSKGPAKARA